MCIRISSLAISRLMLNLRDPELHLHGQRHFQDTTVNGFGFHHRDHNNWLGTGGIITLGRESKLEAEFSPAHAG